MKLSKLIAETALMGAGLFLVLITLSGDTRNIGVVASIASLTLFVISARLKDEDPSAE